jgi:preprotein translocase subunit Sec61beta
MGPAEQKESGDVGWCFHKNTEHTSRARGKRLRTPSADVPVMSSNDGGGLMSSAGLVRYFDAEDKNTIRFDPRSVVAFGVLLGAMILLLNTLII